MKNKNTVLIIYPGGGYGTFFEWCLTYFSGELESYSSPLIAATGSAHNFWGHPLNLEVLPGRNLKSLTIDEYLDSDLNFTFARSHGQTNEYDAQSYVDKYGSAFKHIIELRPDHSVMLEIFLNLLHKIPCEFSNNIIKEAYDLSSITDNDKTWEIREKLSFHLRGRYLWSDSEINHLTAPNIITIPISQLSTQFKNCILKVFDSAGIGVSPTRKLEMDTIFDDWANNQLFLNIHQRCQKFVSAVIAGENYSWPELTKLPLNIFIEAYIQMLLRDLHGFEIKCYNLDVFPTSAKDLKELLINV
jgi:hypothetical protein